MAVDISGWDSWSSWGVCSQQCNQGIQMRTRDCRQEICDGPDTEVRECNFYTCAGMAEPKQSIIKKV